jgi:excinuclease UvrABC ATPase subunit
MSDRADTLGFMWSAEGTEHATDGAVHDWIIGLGPGVGEQGGRVLFTGQPRQLLDQATSAGRHLARLTISG